MKLVDKFDDALEHSTPVRFALRCEQIADEYAVDFAEWVDDKGLEVVLNQKPKNTKELLEIYKIHKEL